MAIQPNGDTEATAKGQVQIGLTTAQVQAHAELMKRTDTLRPQVMWRWIIDTGLARLQEDLAAEKEQERAFAKQREPNRRRVRVKRERV